MNHQNKQCIYYTDNQCEERILQIARNQLLSIFESSQIISVSQYPIDFGMNIVLKENRSDLTMFRQILMGLECATAEYVFFTEHDLLYHPSHFDFTPERDDIFYYNENTYKVDVKNGQTLFYYCKQVSGICVNRELALKHYRRRVKYVETHGFTRKLGFEPGSKRTQIDKCKSDKWMSPLPNVDLRHRNNRTANRFSKDLFRKKPETFILGGEVPGWGRTKDRMEDFLRQVNEVAICSR